MSKAALVRKILRREFFFGILSIVIDRTPVITQDQIKIGVLFSKTGVTAKIELTQYCATILAIEEVNASGGVDGKLLVPVSYDPQSDPKLFRAYAEQLLRVDGARIILGCYMSSARKAVMPIVERHDAFLAYPTLYEGFEYSPNCLYTGAVPNQNLVLLVRYLLENFGHRILLVGSNYIYPYESNRIFSDLIVSGGGKAIDELYVPVVPEASDFDSVLRRIEKLRPDAIFSTVVGAGTSLFYEAYARAGFKGHTHPIASLTTSEAEIADMSVEAALGHVTAAPYFETIDTPVNRSFVSNYKKRFGSSMRLTAAAEAAYFQTHLVARGIAAAGDLDPRRIIAALANTQFDAPQGPVQIDMDNNHTYLWPRVARVNAEKSFEIVWDPKTRVKPDPYFASEVADDWSVGGYCPLEV